MAQTLLHLENITKAFGETKVLNGISLDVQEGEFVTLLGSSGCGKTTTLRIIAGLTPPDGGRVLLEGKDITSLAPEKRPVNTVFQNYALFPHMNVEKNITYGLRIRGVSRRDRKVRAKEMLELVRLPGFEKRMPSELSGGQRQRVAIARSVILAPRLLLLDEPLGALDLKLRREMQTELKAIQKKLGIAFIYITHDQEEALNMSDRIAVMQSGLIEQVGTPEEIYERPKTRYVASFIGQAALFEARVSENGEKALMAHGSAPLNKGGCKPGERISISVHPERIRFSESEVPGFDIPARIIGHRYAGSMIRTEIRTERADVAIIAAGTGVMADLPAPGAKVFVSWDERHQAVIREGGL